MIENCTFGTAITIWKQIMPVPFVSGATPGHSQAWKIATFSGACSWALGPWGQFAGHLQHLNHALTRSPIDLGGFISEPLTIDPWCRPLPPWALLNGFSGCPPGTNDHLESCSCTEGCRSSCLDVWKGQPKRSSTHLTNDCSSAWADLKWATCYWRQAKDLTTLQWVPQCPRNSKTIVQAAQ